MSVPNSSCLLHLHEAKAQCFAHPGEKSAISVSHGGRARAWGTGSIHFVFRVVFSVFFSLMEPMEIFTKLRHDRIG